MPFRRIAAAHVWDTVRPMSAAARIRYVAAEPRTRRRGRRDMPPNTRGVGVASWSDGDAGGEDERRKTQHEGEARHQHRPNAHTRATNRRLFDRSARACWSIANSTIENRILAGERDENDDDLGKRALLRPLSRSATVAAIEKAPPAAWQISPR